MSYFFKTSGDENFTLIISVILTSTYWQRGHVTKTVATLSAVPSFMQIQQGDIISMQ